MSDTQTPDDEDDENEFADGSPPAKYLNHIQARRAANTISNRKVALRQFHDYIDSEGTELENVKAYHIDDWITELLNDDYAPRSVRTKAYTVSDYLQFLDIREIVDNPIPEPKEKLKILKELDSTRIEKHTDVRYLTREQHKQMLDHAQNLRNRLLLRTLWQTGARAQELIDITTDDINQDDREITLTNAKTKRHEDDDTRTVYYNRSLDRTLTKWLDEGGRKKYLGVCGDADEGHLLVTKQAPSMAIGRVNEIVTETAERCGLQEKVYKDQSGRWRRKITTHAYRHSYAVHRVKRGMPLIYLMDLMGHSDIDVTRTYLQFRDDDHREAEQRYAPPPV